MSPTPQELKVATDALRTDARTWERQSDALEGLRTKISELEFGRLEAGLFQGIVSAHTKVVNKMSERCGQGAQRFDEIGDTLRYCADTYEAEDAVGKHRIDNLW